MSIIRVPSHKQPSLISSSPSTSNRPNKDYLSLIPPQLTRKQAQLKEIRAHRELLESEQKSKFVIGSKIKEKKIKLLKQLEIYLQGNSAASIQCEPDLVNKISLTFEEVRQLTYSNTNISLFGHNFGSRVAQMLERFYKMPADAVIPAGLKSPSSAPLGNLVGVKAHSLFVGQAQPDSPSSASIIIKPAGITKVSQLIPANSKFPRAESSGLFAAPASSFSSSAAPAIASRTEQPLTVSEDLMGEGQDRSDLTDREVVATTGGVAGPISEVLERSLIRLGLFPSLIPIVKRRNNVKNIKKDIVKSMNIEERDQDGKTLLMHAVELYCNKVNIQFLINAGADINAVDKNGKTVLMYALKSMSHKSNAQVLINAGADINAVDKDGKSVLMYALERYVNFYKKVENFAVSFLTSSEINYASSIQKIEQQLSDAGFSVEVIDGVKDEDEDDFSESDEEDTYSPSFEEEVENDMKDLIKTIYLNSSNNEGKTALMIAQENLRYYQNAANFLEGMQGSFCQRLKETLGEEVIITWQTLVTLLLNAGRD